MATWGYGRVSQGTGEDANNLETQRKLLEEAGVHPRAIVLEQVSGVRDKPLLQDLLEELKSGDTLVVISLDRLSRSAREGLQTIERLHERGIILRSLHEGVDFSTTVGQLVAQVLMSVSQWQWAEIRAKSLEGQERARAQGKHIGRPKKVSVDLGRKCQAFIDAGYNQTEAAGSLHISVDTLRASIRMLE